MKIIRKNNNESLNNIPDIHQDINIDNIKNPKNQDYKLKSYQEIIAENCKILKTNKEFAKGLMFTFKMKNPLIFSFPNEQKVNFHMFFVFYPIDIVFLNENKKVIDLKENFKPFTIYNPKSKIKYALELPAGTIKEKKIQTNDLLDFTE